MPQPQIGMNQNNNDLVDALLAALSKPVPQTPAGDIRPITVSAQRPTSAPIEQTMAQPQMPSIPTSVPRPAPVLDDNGQTGIGRFLSRLGIPLATAAVGMAAPQTLPGAAGFQTGYAGEVIKDREAERKKKLTQGMIPTYGIDAEGKPTITGYLPKGSKTFRNTEPTERDVQKDAQSLFKALTTADPEAGIRYMGNPELMNKTIDSIAEQIRIKYGVDSPSVSTKTPVENVNANKTNSFNTLAEAEKANLPVGTRIIVGGREAVVR